MEKTNQNLLQKLTQILNVDKIISPEDIEAIRDALIGVLANNKKELESLTEETKQAVNSILDKVLNEHDTYLEKTKQIAQEAKSETTEAINSTLKSLEEVKALCKEVMECKPENGEDADEEYVIGEVLNRIKLPEYKEIVLDDGGAIVDKINSLPVNEENQIDAKHIKNLPEGKGGRVISGGVTRKIVEQMIEAAGAGGTPGGSTTQLQYNNAGAFGGISGATTDGTAVTYTANNLKAADITASGSGGFLIQSNSGTDVGLFGAGGGAGATFYGGVNIDGSLTVDTNTLYVDATNNRVGVGTVTPSYLLHVNAASGTQYIMNSSGIINTFLMSSTVTSRGYVGTLSNHPFTIRTNATDRLTVDATGLVGIGTTAPTHSLTLNSTSTGIALYNTADQTTNYERGRLYWNSNVLTLSTELGGTGIARSLQLVAVGSGSNATLTITRNSLPTLAYTWGSTATTSGSYVTFSGTNTASSGTINAFAITPTINQSSTAGYTALLVNPTETTTGSGTKLLADFQVGGVSKAFISNAGTVSTTSYLTATGDPIGAATSMTSGAYLGFTGSTGKMVLVGSSASLIDFNNTSTNPQTSYAGRIFYSVSSSYMAFGVANAEVMRLTSSGIELGNSSDTTISRSSAGVIAVEGVVIPSISSTNTLTNKFITPQVQSVADAGGTLTPVSITNDIVIATALSQATTIAAPTGSPVQGEKLTIRLKDNGTARALTWNAIYRAIGVTLPTTTVISKIVYVGCIYNSTDTKWDVVSVAQEA